MRSALDLLKVRGTTAAAEEVPMCGENVRDKENLNDTERKRKRFGPGESVWIRGHHPEKTWIPGEIVSPEGERVFKVCTEEGEEKLAHIDQLRKRRSSSRSTRTHFPLGQN